MLSGVHDFVRDELVTLAPDSGAYMNEGDVYESNHEGITIFSTVYTVIEVLHSVILGPELCASSRSEAEVVSPSGASACLFAELRDDLPR